MNGRVVIHHIRNSVNQLNDELRSVVACRRLCPENKSSGYHIQSGVHLQVVIQPNDMQDIQQLSFIFMQTLHLNIKNGIRIDINPLCFLDILRQCNFVFLLDCRKSAAEGGILCIRHQLFQLIQIGNPTLADGFGNQLCQLRIGMEQPSSLGNAVCFVIEFFGIQLIKIMQLLLFQNFRMQCRYPVDRMTPDDCQKCHANLPICNDCHFSDFIGIVPIFFRQLQNETAVDFLHNLINTREQAAE